jgi:hypothetical protein
MLPDVISRQVANHSTENRDPSLFLRFNLFQALTADINKL